MASSAGSIPRGLANDPYILRLTARDAGGNAQHHRDDRQRRRRPEAGQLHPVVHRPDDPRVAASRSRWRRTYDTPDTANQSDDFGYGWRLEFRDTDLRTSVAPDRRRGRADLQPVPRRHARLPHPARRQARGLHLPPERRQTLVFLTRYTSPTSSPIPA